MDKLLELLKGLDISEDSIGEIDKIVKEAVELQILEAKDNMEKELKEQFEADYEEFKNETVDKLSLYLEDVVKENMTIPEDVEKWAKIGKEYASILEALKTKIQLDEGALSEEITKKVEETEGKTKEIQEKLDETIFSQHPRKLFTLLRGDHS